MTYCLLARETDNRKVIVMQAGLFRRLLFNVWSFVWSFLVVLPTSCGSQNQWDETTGARTAGNVGKWFENSWVGAPWGNTTLHSVAGDSVRGSSADGRITIRGSVVRHRIDVEIYRVDDADVRTGYFYLIPDTDSLFVGLRAPDGSWEHFFPLVRE
jgi:hypothetical protein